MKKSSKSTASVRKPNLAKASRILGTALAAAGTPKRVRSERAVKMAATKQRKAAAARAEAARRERERAMLVRATKRAAASKPRAAPVRKPQSAADKRAAVRVAKAAPGLHPRVVVKTVRNSSASAGHPGWSAVLADGSVHPAYKGYGCAIEKGDNYDTALAAYLAAQRAAAGPKLAKGADAHTAPHSAKAVADSRSGRKAAKKLSAKAAAPRQPRGAPKAAQKMTLLVKPAKSGLAAGSGRMAKLELAAKCKLTTDFLGKVVRDASGKEHKCDAGALAGMVKRGHVRLG